MGDEMTVNIAINYVAYREIFTGTGGSYGTCAWGETSWAAVGNLNNGLVAPDFSDVLRGGVGNDQINGGLDNDALSSHAGSDTITGGDGNDFISSSADVLRSVQQLGPNESWLSWRGDRVQRGAVGGADYAIYMIATCAYLTEAGGRFIPQRVAHHQLRRWQRHAHMEVRT
jgi:Ca2+-binding RTX toxin-like protein